MTKAQKKKYKRAHKQLVKWEKKEHTLQKQLKKASAMADRWKKQCDRAKRD